MVGDSAETTRTVVNLLDTLIRFPDIRWITSHGGDTLPLLLARFQELFPWKCSLDPEATKTKIAEQVAAIDGGMTIACYEAPPAGKRGVPSHVEAADGFRPARVPTDQVPVSKDDLPVSMASPTGRSGPPTSATPCSSSRGSPR